jgi:hypothetical protein
MKRTFALIVLLGVMVAGVLAGCEKQEPTPKPAEGAAATNATAAPATNK